jgi:Alkylmercury lyase
MSAETTVSIENLDAAISTACPDLSEEQQRLAVAALRLLAKGEPFGMDALAGCNGRERTTGRTDGPILAGRVPGRARPGGRILRSVHRRNAPHRIRREGVDLHAWCASDPLFLALVVGELEVATDDLLTGDTVTYRIDADGTIHDLSHLESVLSFLRPDAPWDDVMTSFCHYVLQFTDADSARRWTPDHPGIFVIGLAEAQDLARRHATRTFGAAVFLAPENAYP